MRLRGGPICAFLGFCACAASAQQGFYREFYAGITGGAVANLTNAPAFPSAPTTEEIVSGVFETPSNVAENYGQRVRAVITPAVTATNYFFWIASDDASELWLGTNAFPASRRKIAFVSGWTSPRVWTSAVSQCSSALPLTAGTRYYIEALHKEGGGGDNLAVAWLVPGSGVTSVIPAEVIQPYLDAPAIKTQPASAEIYEQWAGARDVSFSVEAVRKAGLSYQWQRDGADLPGATQSVYTCLADLANSNRLFRCCLASLGGAVTSQTARYTFVPDRVPPAVAGWRFSHDRRQLTLTFSEPLLAASVSNGAFAVSGATVAGATLLAGATNVVLRLSDPLAAGVAHALSLAVEDCASPANRLAGEVAVSPAPWAQTPLALIRGELEPPGPSSRRSPFALTEISHTPAPRADGRDLRFVELYNANPYPQEIGGYRFSGAFDYTLPSGTVIAACGYLAVAPAPADLAAICGVTNVVGGFAAAAFDGTSEITLNDELGAWLTTVAYSDEPPWPVAADGSGHTLVLARPSCGEREAGGWAASARVGGSPGAAEPGRPPAYEAVLFNEVLTHAGAAPGFVELHNASTADVSLAGCVITHGKASSPGYVLPADAVLPAGGQLAFDEGTLGFLINGTGDKLWLFAPAGAGGEVIDAVRFGNQELGVACGRQPDGDALWSRLEAPTPGVANAARRVSPVVINEIMYHPISESKDEEYVELFNAGTNAVDLTGWKLGGDIAYAFSETLPAGGYLIVPRDTAALSRLYPERAGQMTGGFGGSLDNGCGTVTLSRPVTVMDATLPEAPVPTQKNVVVEAVTYRDGGEWGKLADGGGSSLERVDPRADPRLARSWAASDETQKSAWTTVAFTGPIDNGFTTTNGDPNAVNVGLMDSGECLVDAVEVKAAAGANLVSNPSFESGTNFWRFMGTHDRSAVEADAEAPDGAAVLHLRASDRCHNGMNIARGLLSAALPKSGTGTVSVRARWLSGSPELLVRTRGSWLEACGDILTTRALGSPGQPNSRACANAAPALFDVIHQPVLPRNGEKVTVYARAQDPDGVSACTLCYRVEGQSGTNAVAMVPAAGGYFAGEIPAGQPNNTIVAFFVEAADGSAQTAFARFPAAAPARECLVRYNEPLDSRVFGIYRFWMTKENIACWAAREKASNQPVDATFLYGTNRVIYHAGLQYAGSPFHSGYTAPINPGASIDYEAGFPSDDQLLDDDGVVLSTIGNLGSDTNGVREQFCYSLARAVQIPHMHRRYIHLYANGAEQNTKKIYEDTEKPNAGVLKHWFPEDSDNDFFKVDDWFEYNLGVTAFDIVTARLQKYTTPDPDGSGPVLKLGRYRWNWLKRGYDTFRANDYTNFFSLVETLNIADTNTYVQRIKEEINLEKFVPVIAVNEFIGNFDSYGFNRGKNMYLYDSAAGWQLIAWDLDYNFGMSRPLNDPLNPALASFPTEDPTMRTFLKTPLVARIFWRAVAKIAAAAGDPALQSLTRAKYDALKADSAVLTGTFDGFMSLVDARRTNVLAQLAAANPTNLTVAVPGEALATSTQNVATVSGTAPFSVTALRINGAEVPITWTSPSNWTAQVVLNSGTNAFTVQAFTEGGDLLPGGSVTRAIVYAGAPLDPIAEFLGFSEIMSAPATNGAAYVEIANRSATTLMNLSGYYLAGAVSFVFPSGTVMKPGDHLCVAENRAAFSAAYGSNLAARVAGAYSGTLPPAGTLLLKRPAAGFEPDDVEIDRVVYEASDPWPEAVPAGTSLRLINPGIDNNRVANWSAEQTVIVSVTNAVPWNMTWKYFTANYPGATWAATNYNDSAWLSGPGPLGNENSMPPPLPIPLATTNTLAGRMAYYFRAAFVFTNEPARSVLKLTYMLDDGAVFYLNGLELCRSSLMPTGAVTDTTAAIAAKTPEGQIEGPFTLSAAALLKGTNTLAVSVHQNQSASSDLVFGMTLEVVTSFTNACSPAAANTLNATLSALPGVWLNEAQPLNASGPADNVGEREPWAELYNAETSAVSLAGWSLAAASADPGWAFPSNASVAAGGFLRVWLDGELGESAGPDALHAGFRLDATNGLLVLRAPVDGREVAADYLRLTNGAADAAWGAFPDGASSPRRRLNPATPGAPNRIDKPACRIVVNEFMAQNERFTNPLNGRLDDWFELFNDGAGTVDLTGYVITDTLVSEAPPAPDLRATKSLVISNGVSLAPGQALRIWTGAAKPYLLPFDPANLQAPFGLSKDGDQICLFDPSSQLVDRLVYTNEQSGTASVGRWVNGAEGGLVSFAQPTPGAPNRNPRFSQAVLAQPPAFALREELPFCHTNGFVSARPASFAFRLYPAEGTALPTNLLFDAEAGVLAWTPGESQGPGLYALRLCGFVADGLCVAACDEVPLTLSVLETPSCPVLGALPAVAVDEGGVATFTVAATRAEEIPPYPTATVLSLVEPLPANAVFDAATGAFRWATGERDGPCTQRFTVVACDVSDTNSWVSAVVTVRVDEVNAPLVYQSPAAFYLWRREPFAVSLQVADPDLPPNRITYGLVSGPEGLALDPETGLLQWQPAAAQTGAFSARIRASDNAGCELDTDITLWVDEAGLQAAALVPKAAEGTLEIRWTSKPDAAYTVEWCADLAAGDWRAVPAAGPVAGTGGLLAVAFSPAAIGSPTHAFFRIRQTR